MFTARINADILNFDCIKEYIQNGSEPLDNEENLKHFLEINLQTFLFYAIPAKPLGRTLAADTFVKAKNLVPTPCHVCAQPIMLFMFFY